MLEKMDMYRGVWIMTILEMIKRVVEVVLLHIDDFVKGLIRAWDPDFTKVTPEERKEQTKQIKK